MKITIDRINDHVHFRAQNEAGNTVDMDNGPDGASPTQLVIMAMGGCSGIDIVDILKKGRQQIDTFSMTLDAVKESVGTYSEFKSVHAHYELTGTLDPAKAVRAVKLSLEKYCTVSKLIQHTATITASCSVNGEHVDVPIG